MNSYENSILVLAHDAGGAEILSSFVCQNKKDYLFCLKGPALKVFQHKVAKLRVISLEQGVEFCDTLLCGTGWQTDFEYQAIKAFKNANKKTIAFLDHWVNYKERFVRYGEKILPNEIWVGDHYAMDIAKKTFPEVNIHLIPNPYFKEIKEQLSTIKQGPSDKKQILYLCEPISVHSEQQYGDPGYWGYTEIEAINHFLDNLHHLGGQYKKIVIRPHPSEKMSKYNWVKNRIDLEVEIGNQVSLLSEIVKCDLVVGCQTMAMVVGFLANKKVISCIPKGGVKCSLPFDCIQDFGRLITDKSITLL